MKIFGPIESTQDVRNESDGKNYILSDEVNFIHVQMK